MAFDRVQPPPEAGQGPSPELGYSREFGKTYVPAEEVERYLILNDEEAGVLSAWGERLIPAAGQWPSAAEVGAPMYVDNCAARSPLLRSMLLRAVALVRVQASESHGRDFAECSGAEQDEILRALESGGHAVLFDLVLELVFEGYYRAGPVLEAVERETGFRVRGPLEGTALEPFDESLLERVRTLPRIYRELAP
jgi:Gluconate 2-dehydrogenase subunit 3